MKRVNDSICDFKSIISKNIYVDKTEYISSLVSLPRRQFFLSRPFGFGKSLLVSTLESVFRGEKELFKGLAIYDKYDFEPFPVIHLDLSGADTTTTESFVEWLMLELKGIADEYDVSPAGSTPAIRFSELIRLIYDKYGKEIVILIDEYDNPVISTLEETQKAEEISLILEMFYKQIRARESMLQFVFLTGAVGLKFDALTILEDISRDSRYASIVGYTEDELDQYFHDYIVEGAAKLSISETELKSRIKNRYGGFCFAPGCERVYNPVSVGSFFSKNYVFDNYCYATATPKMIVSQVRKQKLKLEDIDNARYTSDAYLSFDVMTLTEHSDKRGPLIQLLFQTGCLTIGEQVPGPKKPAWKLVYSNEEARDFFEFLDDLSPKNNKSI